MEFTDYTEFEKVGLADSRDYHSLEDIYQAFKKRLVAELIKEGKLISGTYKSETCLTHNPKTHA